MEGNQLLREPDILQGALPTKGSSVTLKVSVRPFIMIKKASSRPSQGEDHATDQDHEEHHSTERIQ